MSASKTSKTSRLPLLTSVRTRTAATAFAILVPRYKSRSLGPLVLQMDEWDPSLPRKIRDISERRSANRISNYLIPEEIERVRERLVDTDSASIRFGREKKGRGYHGKRGDFCLVAGAIERRNLTLFYRSLELIGGLGYDLCIIEYLGALLDIKWKSVTIHAARANVFALKGNSNEKLFPKLQRIFKC